ncbi:hypothetical protein KM043_002486 [Ampulex compressa]|nr:hypothetical protein KM043_002486 [Ampulex compressa]
MFVSLTKRVAAKSHMAECGGRILSIESQGDPSRSQRPGLPSSRWQVPSATLFQFRINLTCPFVPASPFQRARAPLLHLNVAPAAEDEAVAQVAARRAGLMEMSWD